MHVETARDIALDLAQEPQELAAAMAGIAAPDDLAGGGVERREQAERSVALIVVRTPLELARPHRQKRLGAIQRLDLALFVDAQNQGALRRRQIKPDDIAHFLDKQRVGGEFEGLGAMRLEVEGVPDAVDRRRREAAAFAIERRLQCVASCGVASSVWRTTSATSSSPICRGAPGRGSS